MVIVHDEVCAFGFFPGDNQLRSDKGTVHSFAGHWHFLTRSCCVFSFHRPEISFLYSFDSDWVFPVMLSAIEHLHMRNALDVIVRWLYNVAVSYVFEVFGSDTHLYSLTSQSALFHVADDTFVRYVWLTCNLLWWFTFTACKGCADIPHIDSAGILSLSKGGAKCLATSWHSWRSCDVSLMQWDRISHNLSRNVFKSWISANSTKPLTFVDFFCFETNQGEPISLENVLHSTYGIISEFDWRLFLNLTVGFCHQ